MPTVRNDVFKLGENFVTLIGDEVKVGDMRDTGHAGACGTITRSAPLRRRMSHGAISTSRSPSRATACRLRRALITKRSEVMTS